MSRHHRIARKLGGAAAALALSVPVALAQSAPQDLEASLRELAGLRDQISAEKVPLTKEMSALEQKLAALRQEQDATLRRIDAGTLDSSILEQERKLREDELTYVTNLLDEYVRTFESRLAVGETTRYREAIETAKDAPTNGALTREEKLGRQLEVLNASVSRVEQLIGGDRFAGQAVEPGGTVVDGRFALIGPVSLFAAGGRGPAGIAMAQAGTAQPAVRPLEQASLNEGVASTIERGEGVVPLDPTGGGALKALVQKTNLIHIFKKGGPIMWPLLFVSILALGTAIERILFIGNEQRKRDSKALRDFLAAAQDGNIDKAVGVGKKTKFFVVRTLSYALEHRERSLANALLYANAQEIKRFSRGVAILDTSITIAPLLGLLGTVTGMMRSFSLIGGELSAPGAITGGIAEALIATAFGLGIAIVALVPYNYLNNQIEHARHELETAGHQLELIVRGMSMEAGGSLALAAGGRS
jgi:biopolymer transport protein ExbB